MAYTELEQNTIDLDLYLEDVEKSIHIASGGGRIPERIAQSDIAIEEFKDNLNDINESNEILINPNLQELLNLNTDEALELYLRDFVKRARQGFYSYDKTYVGEFDDFTFHLVAKPKKKSKIEVKHSLLKLDSIMPEEFTTFKLDEYAK